MELNGKQILRNSSDVKKYLIGTDDLSDDNTEDEFTSQHDDDDGDETETNGGSDDQITVDRVVYIFLWIIYRHHHALLYSFSKLLHTLDNGFKCNFMLKE